MTFISRSHMVKIGYPNIHHLYSATYDITFLLFNQLEPPVQLTLEQHAKSFCLRTLALAIVTEYSPINNMRPPGLSFWLKCT